MKIKKQICFEDFAGIPFGTGIIKQDSADILHVVWKSGLCLQVRAYRYKPYYVMLSKEDTELDCIYCYSKSEVLSYVRNFARDIEAGKYRNKKTLREQAFQIVQDRNLTSYMNNTKWEKLLEIVNQKLPFKPEQVYKTLLDDEIQPLSCIPRSPGCYCDECFPQQFYLLEWVRLTPRYAVNHGGYLVEKLEIHDETPELIQELEKAHIPFQTDHQDILIYGYH